MNLINTPDTMTFGYPNVETTGSTPDNPTSTVENKKRIYVSTGTDGNGIPAMSEHIFCIYKALKDKYEILFLNGGNGLQIYGINIWCHDGIGLVVYCDVAMARAFAFELRKEAAEALIAAGMSEVLTKGKNPYLKSTISIQSRNIVKKENLDEITAHRVFLGFAKSGEYIGYSYAILDSDMNTINTNSGKCPSKSYTAVYGELMSLFKALKYLKENNINSANVVYTAMGIPFWMNGSWNAPNQMVLDFINVIKKHGLDKMNLTFSKMADNKIVTDVMEVAQKQLPC